MFPWTAVKTEFLESLLKPKANVRELQSAKIFIYLSNFLLYMGLVYLYKYALCVRICELHACYSSSRNLWRAPGFECPSSCGRIAEVLCSHWSHCTESCKTPHHELQGHWSWKMQKYWFVYCLCQNSQICSFLRICWKALGMCADVCNLNYKALRWS